MVAGLRLVSSMSVILTGPEVTGKVVKATEEKLLPGNVEGTEEDEVITGEDSGREVLISSTEKSFVGATVSELWLLTVVFVECEKP